MTSLPDIVSATIERRHLLRPDQPVLLMVSGGGDSMALLALATAGVVGPGPFKVLHVNHLLRDGHSFEDERFVVDACAAAGIDCETVRYDVSAYAATEGLNLEDAGRRVRYRFADETLDAWCRDLGVTPSDGLIATAHSRDDRVETFFTRAVSGAGPGALASIRARRGRIVRPLIDCDRAAIRSWLESVGGAWREDLSNNDTSRARAYVRANLLPAAQQLNPAFRENLTRTLDLLADDDALLSSLAQAFSVQFAESRHEDRVVFDRAMMATLDRTMARRVVREALTATFEDAGRIEAVHIEALTDGLSDDGFSRDLPGSLRAMSEYGSMVVSRSDAQVPRVAPGLLSLPGNADLGDAGTITARRVDSSQFDGDSRSVVIDAGAVHGTLTIDAPREGDRMRPLGMEGTRKLSDLLIDAKVPRRLRLATPVVRDGERIVWIAGVRMSDEYRVGPATTTAYRLEWTGRADGID